MQRTENGNAGLALYLTLVLGMTAMAGITSTAAVSGDWVGWPFAVAFAALAILIGWFGRSYATNTITDWRWRLVRFVRYNWQVGIVLVVIGVAALTALYYAFTFVVWLFTETPQHRAQREANERYQADKVVYRQHVAACAKKNGDRHFGPMIGFVPIDGGCGLGSRNNGVVCTWNNGFQSELKELWDDARARNACVVYRDTTVGYTGSTRRDRRVVAYGDDGRDNPIYLGLRGKK